MLMAEKDRPVAPTEVVPKARRRTFSAEYKRRILGEADARTEYGALGKLLRREGLYSSHVLDWRAARERGEIDVAAAPVKRGPAPKVLDERDRKIAELEREVDRLRARAERAEGLVVVQKKLAELLGRPLPERSEKR
jgi:transposase-like protein